MSEKSSPESEALIGKTVRQIIGFSERWSFGRPWHPYALEAEDLSLDLRICLINTRHPEVEQLRYAKHYIVRNEPRPDMSQTGQSSVRHTVLLEQVDASGQTLPSGEHSPYANLPLCLLGIEPNPNNDNLYERYAYAIRYDDAVLCLKLALNA